MPAAQTKQHLYCAVCTALLTMIKIFIRLAMQCTSDSRDFVIATALPLPIAVAIAASRAYVTRHICPESGPQMHVCSWPSPGRVPAALRKGPILARGRTGTPVLNTPESQMES